MMYVVGVVPENAEILCGGFEPRETKDRFIGIGIALGIGILGHAPDSFDGLISLTSFSTRSISGPSGVMGTLIISMPKYSVMAKCLS